MKLFRIPTILFFAAFCFIMTACSDQKPAAEKTASEKAKVENLATTPQDIKKEAADLAKTTMAYTEEQKALFQKKFQEKMAQYNEKLQELEAKLATVNEQAKADMAAEMKELRMKQAELGDKLKELQTKGGEAYADFKKGLDSAIEQMDQAFDQARERFKK